VPTAVATGGLEHPAERVSAARRTWRKPASASRERQVASGTWLPRPSPPWERALGTQMNGEAEEKIRPTGLRLSSIRSPAAFANDLVREVLHQTSPRPTRP
jgi:hypothetical protein